MKSLLLKLFGELGEFLRIFLKEGIQRQLKILIPIATKYVRMVAADPSLITGKAKQEAVFVAILDELGDKQGDFAKSMINFAIEYAVVEFQEIAK